MRTRTNYTSRFLLWGTAAIFSSVCCGVTLAAQDIPGSADAGRLQTSPRTILPERKTPPIPLPKFDASEETPAPENADALTFVLGNVVIEGMSAFSQEDMADIYRPLIGQEIQVSRIWELADRITRRYQKKGYFLSRAYVPAQEIDSGTVTLRVIEGYIGAVRIEGDDEDNYLVDMLERRITEQKPSRLQDLERAVLLLGDIPGHSFETVLERMEKDAPEGAVGLVLRKSSVSGRGSLAVDNHGSLFSGPLRASLAYEDSFLKNQNTAISGIASLPDGDELRSAAFTHEIRILPEAGLEISLGRTLSYPGYTLSPSDIESRADNWGIKLNWQAIRQRQNNMSFSLALEGRNVNTDILWGKH